MWPRSRPDGALALLARLLPPIGIVVGIYILWVGAIAPGGAFQGGAILAAMWLLVMIAGLADAPEIGQRWLRLRAGRRAGGVPGGRVRGIRPAGRLPVVPGAAHAKPLIIVIEAVLTLSIAAILGLLVAGPPERERQR